MSDDQIYKKFPVLCLTCGQTSDKILPIDAKGIWAAVDKARCPKCSKDAYVLNPLRTRFLLEAIVKKVIAMRGDIFDLQASFDGPESDTPTPAKGD